MIKYSDSIEKYILEHTQQIPEYLNDISRETHLTQIHPRMLSGPVQGRFLKMIVSMVKPSRVLEIGTFTAYSALCIAEALSNNAVLDTIEIDEELHESIERNIAKSPFGNKINVLIGDALDIIPTLNNSYDMVFIDGNKRHYGEYYNALFDKLNNGGYILADNVLWDGHVINEDKFNDPQTAGIISFNDLIRNDERVENVLLPLRDGIMMIRKL